MPATQKCIVLVTHSYFCIFPLTEQEYSFQEFRGYQLIISPIFQPSRTNWL